MDRRVISIRLLVSVSEVVNVEPSVVIDLGNLVKEVLVSGKVSVG